MHVASSVMNAVLLLLVGFSAVMWIAAPWLVPTVVALFRCENVAREVTP